MSRLSCQRTVTGVDEVERPATVEVGEDGRIVAVDDGIDPRAEEIDGWLVPGFVDTHCHGALGVHLTDADPEGVAAAIALHRRHGTTSLFASTITSSLHTLVEHLDRLRPLVDDGELAGVHIEGPFLQAERFGAHEAPLLMDRGTEAVERIIEAGDGIVRSFTLDPERNHGLETIRALAAAGIAPAFGHSQADDVTARRAIEEGVRVATHLFNAMRPIDHLVPGPVPVLLNDDRVAVELVCDGWHVHPMLVELAIRAAGPERVILVTDATGATGCEPGRHVFGQTPVEVVDGSARVLNIDGTPGQLAGSTLTMNRAVEFATRRGQSPVAVARMASTTPARVYGLADVGSLEPGKWADLCVLGEGGALRRVMRRGQWVDALAS